MSVKSADVRILVVDDDRETLDFLSDQLGTRGFRVETARSGGQAVEMAGRDRFDLAICDLKMPLMDGIACMETITHLNPSLQVIMISGEATVDNAVSAMKKGAYDFVQKPVQMESLLCLIDKALLKNKLEAMAALYERSREILSQLDLKELLDPALKSVVAFFRAEQGFWINVEDSAFEISSSCGLEGPNPQKAALDVARMAAEDAKQNARILGGTLWVTLRRNGRPAAVFLVRRAPGSEDFTLSELREASAFAERLMRTIETSKLHRSLDIQIAQLRRTYAELEESKNLLAQKEKLARLGGLLAGIAHEINSPLATVMGYADLLLHSSTTEQRSKERLSLIHSEAQRCSHMINEILNYARTQKPHFCWVRAQTVVDETIQLLTLEFKREGVEVTVRAPEAPVGLAADPHQLKQVLVNLLRNAMQATQGLSKRRILIEMEGGRVNVRLNVQIGRAHV